ncbi:hypothetical protein FHX82_001605 [Amycolatopsis bartoniae]|uniref:Uncharacterized protein n=1 Tax=Amycolatopsis bartoniae TaxID=941986 RepID=A0A8H9ISD0_9PSEU|nr:hypothetical protein [Amycolatopsis bartoniae]MBB2934585.1 hypothetical protein [Amycolatopsis bartoniae]TVT06915.1 hypothetical protein FNH07_18395 [Amycolatopsis bartoniae]GHF46290.1 hypothetical protein GCM10017566_19230 [Amycolatopsis bartoniae]
MAEAISDKQIVRVLRPFVRAARPVLHAMCRPGRIEGLANVKLPGTPAWDGMTRDEHIDWWINRVGRLTSLVTAIPGLGGVLADRLPVQDALGASAQGLLLCAIAGEHGVDDVGERVRLVAWVLFQRDIDPALAAGKDGAEDAQTAELAGEFGEQHERKITPKGVATTLWRMGRSLLAVSGELEKRPRGRFYQRALGMLPVVGMAGDYLAERSGLKKVAKRANVWLSGART